MSDSTYVAVYYIHLLHIQMYWPSTSRLLPL